MYNCSFYFKFLELRLVSTILCKYLPLCERNSRIGYHIEVYRDRLIFGKTPKGTRGFQSTAWRLRWCNKSSTSTLSEVIFWRAVPRVAEPVRVINYNAIHAVIIKLETSFCAYYYSCYSLFVFTSVQWITAKIVDCFLLRM